MMQKDGGGKDWVLNYEHRQAIFEQIEQNRDTRVLSFITSDRQNMETEIAQDCVDLFVNLLEEIGPTERISLILHTNGGQTLAAWRLVNLIRMFCDDFEVLIPFKALSAGTLISIGADRIVMSKQAAIGAIDPSVNGPLNPRIAIGDQARAVPVSVESIRGYLDMARNELGIKGESAVASVLSNLSEKVHPLVLGESYRAIGQIRFLAEKLLPYQVDDAIKMKSIIEFLCAESGSHDYTLNRREAVELGLKVEKPTDELYRLMRDVHLSYLDELQLLEPYTPEIHLAGVGPGEPIEYQVPRAFIEGTVGGCYSFVSNGTCTRFQVQTPEGVQEPILDQRKFDGWRKLQ